LKPVGTNGLHLPLFYCIILLVSCYYLFRCRGIIKFNLSS
jgi:hypothetical protein